MSKASTRLLDSSVSFVRFFDNQIQSWTLTVNDCIALYTNHHQHSSDAILLDESSLFFFDFQVGEFDKESFVLVDVDSNRVVNRVGFEDRQRVGCDIHSSFLVDGFKRVFFSTKFHLGGDGRRSKLYCLHLLNFEDPEDDQERMGLHFLYEESSEILFMVMETETEGGLTREHLHFVLDREPRTQENQLHTRPDPTGRLQRFCRRRAAPLRLQALSCAFPKSKNDRRNPLPCRFLGEQPSHP